MGATLNFTGTGLGVDARNRVLFTAQAPGNLPVWARYNTTEFAAYDATNGIVAATYTDINTMSSVVPNTAGATVRINNVAGVANNTLGRNHDHDQRTDSECRRPLHPGYGCDRHPANDGHCH